MNHHSYICSISLHIRTDSKRYLAHDNVSTKEESIFLTFEFSVDLIHHSFFIRWQGKYMEIRSMPVKSFVFNAMSWQLPDKSYVDKAVQVFSQIEVLWMWTMIRMNDCCFHFHGLGSNPVRITQFYFLSHFRTFHFPSTFFFKLKNDASLYV